MSADGRLIAGVVRTRPGDHFAIRVARPNGTRLRTLDAVPGCFFRGGYDPAVADIEFVGDDLIVHQSSC